MVSGRYDNDNGRQANSDDGVAHDNENNLNLYANSIQTKLSTLE